MIDNQNRTIGDFTFDLNDAKIFAEPKYPKIKFRFFQRLSLWKSFKSK